MTDPDNDPVHAEAAEMIERYRASSPDVAEAFVQMLDHIRRDEAWASVARTMQQMAEHNSIGAILRRQARVMNEIRTSHQEVTLLPDFTGSNYRELERAVLSLMPSTIAEVSEIERAAAEASNDPASRTLIDRIADRLPDGPDIARKAAWTGFYLVCTTLIEMAPELNSNTIAMLGVLVAVWAVLVQRSKQ